MSDIKIAKNDHHIIDLIKNRWSALAFSNLAISKESMNSLFEAARWAASSNNEQPWQYYYAHKGTEGFNNMWECLMPGNQPWTKDAAVLVACIAKKTFEANQKENVFAWHDLGMANANLLIQATSIHIHGHIMAGVDRAKLTEKLLLTENQTPVCVIALGYLGDANTLNEPYKTRELKERSRKPITDFVKEV